MNPRQTLLNWTHSLLPDQIPEYGFSIREVMSRAGAVCGTNVAGQALQALGWTRRVCNRRSNPHYGQNRWYPPMIDPSKVEADTTAAAEAVIEEVSAEATLRSRIHALETQLKAAKKDHVDAEYVKTEILKLAVSNPTPPQWLVAPSPEVAKKDSSPGVPILFASDWHWGEVVDPLQVGGVNRFNLAVARDRAHRLVSNTIYLLKEHMVNPNYPGIVFALGGDMVSGDIHEELSATNETEIMPVVLDLFGTLIWSIDTLKAKFGRVFVPAVSGNHARTTQKIRAKGRTHTSFDWLVYQLLARHYQGDDAVSFQIPDGPDALFSVYGHRYLLTHGDQFRGGDGMIGALGPIIRGDHKKRSRNTQVGQGYDTMLLGHWHQLIQLQRLIVNGSLVGYNEYAYAGNFPFEPPRQALWINHPTHGITFSLPVMVDPVTKTSAKQGWVEWKE